MKKRLLPLFVLLATICVSFAQSTDGPLEITATNQWEVNYQAGASHYYTITRKDGESALLMIHKSPTIRDMEQISLELDQFAELFLQEVKKNPAVLLESEDYQKVAIEGVEFSGQAVIFTIEGGIYQTSFKVNDVNGTWGGQFTGSKKHWAQAIQLLQQLKRKKSN